jgi:WhiB family redox-sensing transcriptional regulator
MERAHCRGEDPSAFFPSDSLGVEAARRICKGCGVRRECLQYALEEHLVHGIFGGSSERQRERLRRASANRP